MNTGLIGKNKWMACLFVLGVVVFMGTRWGRMAVSEEARAHLAAVAQRDFDIEIKTIGVLDAARSHMISSALRGDKGKIVYLVEDGHHVNEGTVLVKFDATPFEEEIHKLVGELARYTAALDADHQALEWEKSQVARQIKTAAFHLEVARLEYETLVQGEGPIKLTQLKSDTLKIQEELEKYMAYASELERLRNSGYDFTTEVALATDKTSELKEKLVAARSNYDSYKNHVFPSLVETAKAKIKNAEMEYEQIKNGSVYKIAKAQSGLNETRGMVDNTQAALERARKALENTVITAPYPGIAILFETFRDGQKRKPRIGDKIWENQPLLYLPDVSAMVVNTQVREIDLHKIFLDQPCSIAVDAYPEVSFEGKVMFIGVLATDRLEGGAGEKYFDITIALKGSDMRLRPGMTARVTLINEQLRDVLSAPVQAVFSDTVGKYCYRRCGSGFEKAAVTVGRQNENFVEIISGLEPGDRVSLVTPSPEDLR